MKIKSVIIFLIFFFVMPAFAFAERNSYLSRLWDLDNTMGSNNYALMPYKPFYFLFGAYNISPNKENFSQLFPDGTMKNIEARFQVSFKVKVLQLKKLLNKEADIWFGYTQKSFWQIYNPALSSPFRETNCELEFLLNFPMNLDIFGIKWRIFNLGYNHHSNGRSQPLSRSWNRAVANFGFETENLVILLNTWYRIPEDEEEDDNPDIKDYMGNGELRVHYLWEKIRSRAGFMLRHNCDFDNNKGSAQLDYQFILSNSLSLYVQYFRGYGENLLDYNHDAETISAGVMLTDIQLSKR